jgi:enterochelin esterase-like enzyme
MSRLHFTAIILFIVALAGCQPSGSTPAASPTAVLTAQPPRSTANPNRTLSPPPYRQTAFPTGMYTALPDIPRLQTPFRRRQLTAEFQPTPVETPAPETAACRATEGVIERHSLETDLLNKPVFIRVYLPPCYDAHHIGGYPVLILLHGQSTDDEQWVRMGATDAADLMIERGDLPPFLIVLPNEEYYLKDPSESTFGRIVAEDVTAWVKETYNACRDRHCWAIGGVSRGASWAMELGLNYYDTFGAVATHSQAVFNGFFELAPQWIKAIPPALMPRLAMDIGRDDYLYLSTKQFEQTLTDNRVLHEWTVNNGIHEEAYWSVHMEDYLAWYARSWKP